MSTLNTTNLKHPSSGSNNIVLAADGSTTIATLSATDITGTTIQGTIKSGTAVASTSGTSIDFTGIPSWVKRITVMFSGVSTNGTSLPQIQLGDSGGFETTSYAATSAYVAATTVANANYTSGFVIRTDALASVTMNGYVTLNLITGSTNTWAAGGVLAAQTPSAYLALVGGTKSLSDTLTQVRITTVNGTDTFDAGTINILFEG
jgi:hypothetical protein